MSKTSPTQIDAHIGNRLKLARMKADKSLQEVGNIIGVSFQQIQKYERGQNKVSSSNLFIIAQYLKTEIQYFFDGLDISFRKDGFELNDSNQEFTYDNSAISEQEFAALVKNYSMIANIADRKKVLEVVKSISSVLTENHALEQSTVKKPAPLHLNQDKNHALELKLSTTIKPPEHLALGTEAVRGGAVLADNPALEMVKSISSILAEQTQPESDKNISTSLDADAALESAIEKNLISGVAKNKAADAVSELAKNIKTVLAKHPASDKNLSSSSEAELELAIGDIITAGLTKNKRS